MTDRQLMAIAAIVVGFLVFCAVPVVVASARRSPDVRMIAKLAPLSLLSFALWFALIAWGASGKRDDGIVSRYIAKVQERNLGPWIIGGLVALGLASSAIAFAVT